MWPHNQEHPFDPTEPPGPEAWLTAYVDGELGEAERARVEAWLASDPGARAEVEAQRRLKDVCERGAVPEPGAPAWDGLLVRIETALHSPGGSGGWRGVRRWAPGLAAAAAVLLALWVGQRHRPNEGGPDDHRPGVDDLAGDVVEVASDADVVIHDMDPADAERGAVVVGRVPGPGSFEVKPGELLEVAAPSDVVIISMDMADTENLVVGELPVSGPLVLAAAEDVEVEHLAPHPADDMRPFLHAPPGSAPMLVVPLKPMHRPPGAPYAKD
jgi:Putative zinc-finger